MYLRRERLIRKQLELNRASKNWVPLPQETLRKLQSRAHEQLSLAKIVNRQMDYSKIDLFLLLSSAQQRNSFYSKFRNDLTALFKDEKAQKTFETKWTLALKSNVMRCFGKIALEFFAAQPDDPIRIHLAPLYTETLDKLLTLDKLSRIEEKFLQPFLIESLKRGLSLETFLGVAANQRLLKSAQNLSKMLQQRQNPKTLTSNQFLKYCGMRILGVALPHQKYLHNQLLHAPNPKYLFPFRRRGTFLALTNELLLKSNKLDMVGCQFWSYYEYEESDLYERIRRAAEWGGRVDILLMLIRSKLVFGLQRCLNLINEKVLYFSSRALTEQGFNTLMSLVETAISICNNRSPKETLFQNALEKVDIGQIFQHSLLTKQSRLRPFAVALLQLYLRLLIACPKRHLRIKFVPHLALQLNRFLDVHNDSKFTSDLTAVVLQLAGKLYPEQRAEFLYSMVQSANHEWQSRQELLVSNEVALISPQSVKLIAEFVSMFGFSDEGRSECKVLKLQFYYILALNYKESDYIQSKQKLSRTLLDINPSLSNNSVFNVLRTRTATHEAFRSHLKTLYGDEILQIDNLEHQGLLAVIDQVITYRMQEAKSFIDAANCERVSFYTIMTSLLEQVQRLQGKLLKLVRNYFSKCRKTYWIQVVRIKGQDQSRSYARQLITRDACVLIQGCVSANPVVADFSWQVLQEYIQKVPELAIYTGVLVVWAQCITILYRKSNQEYESRSQRLKGKSLVSGTPIPTERKDILSRLAVLMRGLYQVVLRGHLIDNNYLGVRVQYLIRENCKSASFGFGWKYLKHLTNSYKDDQQFIAKEVLTNNSCSWFVNEEYFNSRLKNIKPEKMLLDKYLIPLHEGEVSQTELKKIFAAVEPQTETEFVTIPPKSSAVEVVRVVAELESLCLEIESMQGDPSKVDALEQLYSSLFDVVSRVKMIFITNQNQALVFSQILDVCRRYNNVRLLQHTLLKIVPFFYCLNEFNWRIVQTLAEMLHFVVSELNTTCRRPSEGPKLASSTFDARLGQFEPVRVYELRQTKIPGSRHKILIEHERRVSNLKQMYGQLIQFFGSHMHVCIAKGYSLSLLLKVCSINFLLENTVLAQLPLQSIGRCLLSQLQLVNVLKSALEKGQNSFDESVVDNFYLKTLKSALLHFQREDAPQDELITPSFQIKQLKQKIDFLIQICDYLRNDDFHQLSKKKLPKRNELFAKKQNEVLLLQLLDLAQNKKYKRKMSNPQPRPVSNHGQAQVDLTVLRYSLLYLISQQIDKIKAYAYPQLCSIPNPYSLAGKKGFISNRMVQDLLAFLTPKKGSVLIYNFLHIFGDRVQNASAIMRQIEAYVTKHPAYNYPPFLSLFVDKFKSDASKLRELNYWRAPHIPVLLKYLSKQYQNSPSLQRYVTKVLAHLEADQILFYLPQIFQALTLSSGQVIAYFLLQYARKSACFAHQLIWLAQVQSKQERDPHNKSPRLPGVEQHLSKLQQLAKKLIRHTVSQFNREEKCFFKEVNDFYEQVTAISGKMRPQMPPADKKDIIHDEVCKIKTPKSAYLLFNPTFQVLSINRDSGTPMQSAAKCPFLLTFNCTPYVGPDLHFQQRKQQRKRKSLDDSDEDLPQEQVSKPMKSMSIMGSRVNTFSEKFNSNASQARSDNNADSIVTMSENRSRSRIEETQISCIFKVFDDIRQDCLALQIIRLFLQIFERHNLGLNLFPYHTLSNRTGPNLDIGGIIEVVPNCVSRDSIGKTNQQSLYQFFLSNFGPQHNFRFQQARQNFIRSQAAYSVVSYILQVKDRHNGNILVDKQKGFLVHIDFGFILDISPANNLRFERAHFKLTEEMIHIMGGSVESQPFQLYLTLVIKGFLLARRYHEHVFNFVSLMASSGLPCFLMKSLENLQSRFLLHLSEIEAAQKMRQIVLSAADHWTTNWYDRIQWMQQKIYH